MKPITWLFVANVTIGSVAASSASSSSGQDNKVQLAQGMTAGKATVGSQTEAASQGTETLGS
jgi:hypothetical protein